MLFVFAILIGLMTGCGFSSLYKLIDEDYTLSGIFGLLSLVFGILTFLVAKGGI